MAHHITQYDTVRINRGTYAGMLGYVHEIVGERARVFVYGSDLESDLRSYRISSLDYIPPITLTADELARLARFDTDVLAPIVAQPYAPIFAEDDYQMTLDDLQVALEAIVTSSKEGSEEEARWCETVFGELSDYLGIYDYINDEVETEGDHVPGMPSEQNVFHDIMCVLCDRHEPDVADTTDAPSVPDLLERIRIYKRDRSKPLAERELSQDQMKWFLKVWDNDRVGLFGTPEITAMYVRAVRALAAANVPIGLHELAYACYGKGNVGFDEDWITSRDCLLKLEEISPKSQYANTLGYIYYYGRCNDGVPEYDKAFYWFSIGAAGGIYEARYKLADMFKDGKGCHKDQEIAAHIIWDLYNENLPYMCRGIGNTKFADIALRVGNLHRDGINCPVNLDEAYGYYLMAKLAIRMRRQCCDAYGDTSVERIIDQALEETLPGTWYAKKETTVGVYLPSLLRFAVGGGRRLRMDYRQTSENTYRLTFSIQKRPGKRYASKLLVLLPEAHFCGLLEKLAVNLVATTAQGLDGTSGSIVFDEVATNWPDYGGLMLFGEKRCQIDGHFTVNCRNLAGKKRRYVSVSFDDPNRCWNYLCDDESVAHGSVVRVPYGKEVRTGTVKRVCERFDSEVELPKRAYKRVL